MAIVKKVRKLGTRPGFGAASRDASALRPAFVDKTPPCGWGCPNGTDVRGLLTTLALGESRGLSRDQIVDSAFRLLADRNPLPATAGHVCVHHCEDGCHRAGLDEALAVNEVERAVGEAALALKLPLQRLLPPVRPERVAVVGAGPAGLSAAYQLARLGYAVTVFDPRPGPGGELLKAIEEGRVPRAVVEAEIARIEEFGIRFECAWGGTGNGAGDDGEPGRDGGAGLQPCPTASPNACPTADQAGAALEGFARVIRTRIDGARDVAAGLAAAIHYGRHAAQLVDAELRGVAIHRLSGGPRVARERIRLDLVGVAASFPAGGGRVRTTGRTLTIDETIAEARRCLACGGCLECDNCWKYCPDQAVIKPLERGQPYRFRLEFCQGCSKCAEECPTGYIEMR